MSRARVNALLSTIAMDREGARVFGLVLLWRRPLWALSICCGHLTVMFGPHVADGPGDRVLIPWPGKGAES